MYNLKALRILVVEDNPGDFFLLKERLSETSVNTESIVCAETLSAASDFLQDSCFDIILLDLTLPDASGADTFRQIKAVAPDTPVVVLSGSRDRKLALQTIHDGAQDYLLKDHLNAVALDKSICHSIERMRYTRKLVENAEKLHFQSTVLSSITDAVIVTDLEKNVVYWNRAATEIYGYASDEMMGRNMLLLAVDPNDMTDPVTLARRLKNEPFVRSVVRRRTKSGTVIWVDQSISYYYDVNEKTSGLICISKDITDIKAEEHLLTLFQSVILNSKDAVIITEAKGRELRRIVFVNRAFTDMTGFSADEIIGSSLMRLTGPLTDMAEIGRIKQAMDRWEPSETTVRCYRKDGEVLWVTLNIMPVSDHVGSFTHWVFIQRDVTELRMAVEKQQKQNEELSTANRELDRFVYSASHDLRAPLTSILGLVELMRRESFAKDAAAFLDRIHVSVQRLDKLIQNIINYSRNSRLAIQSKPIDFRELFESSLELHRFIDPAREIQTAYSNALVHDFHSDPERWQIVFNNLVSNSIKFAKQGVLLTISLDVRIKEDRLCLSFLDNGIGIMPEQARQVFEMFYRATDNTDGSGLGLYIVKQTVELLGGTIFLESEPGQFTRFIIEMPIEPNPQPDAEKSSRTAAG